MYNFLLDFHFRLSPWHFPHFFYTGRRVVRWWLAFIVSRDALPADWLVALREGFLFLFFLACRRRRRAEVHSRGTSTFLDEIGVSLCHRHLHNRKATIHRWCGSESRPRSGRKKWQMMKYAGVREKKETTSVVQSRLVGWVISFMRGKYNSITNFNTLGIESKVHREGDVQNDLWVWSYLAFVLGPSIIQPSWAHFWASFILFSSKIVNYT